MKSQKVNFAHTYYCVWGLCVLFATNQWKQPLSFGDQLVSLAMMFPVTSILFWKDFICFYSSVMVYLCHTFHYVISWLTLGWFHNLAIKSWAAMNTRVQTHFLSFGWILKIKKAGSSGVSIFRFLRNLCIVFHNW